MEMVPCHMGMVPCHMEKVACHRVQIAFREPGHICRKMGRVCHKMGLLACRKDQRASSQTGDAEVYRGEARGTCRNRAFSYRTSEVCYSQWKLSKAC